MIVSFIGYKGGSGKSTCAANFGVIAAHRGYRVVLADLDAQRSVVTWASLRQAGAPEVIAMRAHGLQGFAGRFHDEICVVDAPGHDWTTLKAVASIADLNVIVARPTILDIDVALTVRDALERLRRDWVILLNQVPTRASSSRLATWAQAYADLGTIVVPPLPALFAFQDAMARGLGVSEFAPGERADIEMRQAAGWILRRIGVRP